MIIPPAASGVGTAPLPTRWAGRLLFVLAAYVFAQAVSTWLRVLPDRVTPMWMPLGFIMGVYLATPRNQWWRYVLVSLAGQVLAAILLGLSYVEVFPVWIFATAGALSTSWLVQRFTEPVNLFHPRGLLCLFGFTLVANVIVVIPATFVLIETRHTEFHTTLLQNFSNGQLSSMILVPVTASVMAAWERKFHLIPRRLLESVVRVLLIAVAAYLAFWINDGRGYRQPMILLPLPLLLWSALRFGVRGTAFDLLIICAMAFAASKFHMGPFRELNPDERTYGLQLQMLAMSLPILFSAGAIAERLVAQEATRTRERLFRGFIENAPVPIVLVPSPDGQPIYFNPAFTRAFGYTHEDLKFPEDWWTLAYPDPEYRARRQANWRKFADRARETGQFQDDELAEMRTRDGNRLYAQARLSFVDGYRLSFINDLTGRKHAEDEAHGHLLRIRSLAAELARSEERQRRELAEVLHDGVGQNLFAAITQLVALRNRSDNGVAGDINRVLESLDVVSRSTRDLTFELCPPELYQMGLSAAVRRLALKFSERFAFQVNVAGDEGGPEDLNARGLLYHAVRELLSNAAKHAHARHVDITLQRGDAHHLVSVCDDGVGFAPDALRGPTRGFGLFHLKERLELFGGSLEVAAGSPSGSVVRISLPTDPAFKR